MEKTSNSGEISAILSLLPPYAQDPSFPPVSSPCAQTGLGPLTIFWVLPIATLPQHGLTGVAAEAVPMKETAFSTEAFQDIEVFPTECTQLPGTSLHRPPDHRVSWSPGQLQRSSFPLKHSFLPSQASVDSAPFLTSWFWDGGVGGTPESGAGGSSTLGLLAST